MFASHDAAIAAVRLYCHSKGFVVKKKKDNKAQTKDSVATIYYFVCGRAGEYKNYREHLTEASRIRNTKTHLCGCPFKVSIRAWGTQWMIQFDYVLHNHEPTSDLKSLRNARRMSPDQLDLIKKMTDAGASVKVTLAALHTSDKTTLLIDRDIMNARQKLQADELKGRRERCRSSLTSS